MDKKVVITQAIQGVYPSDWLVYYGRDDYVFCIIFSVIATLLLILTLVTLILSAFDAFALFASMAILYLIFLGLPLSISVTAALLLYRRAKAINHSILVILPEVLYNVMLVI